MIPTGYYKSGGLAALVAGLSVLGCSGCGHPSSVAKPRAFIRISALVGMDPAARQAAYLLKLQHISNVDANRQLPKVSLPATARLFPSPPFSVISLASQRTANMQDSVTRYLARYRQILEAATRIPYELYAREKTEKAREQYRTELLALQNRLYQDAQYRASGLQPAITNLRLRLIAVQSQERVFTGQPLRDARSQDVLIAKKLSDMENAQRAIVAAVQSEARNQLEPRKAELKSQLANSLTAYKAQLSRELETRMHDAAAAQANLLTQLNLGLNGPHLPVIANREGEVPFNLPLRDGWQEARQLSAAQFQNSRAVSAKVIAQQVKLLEYSARQNVHAVAQQVATQQGFVLVDRPTAGAADITSLVAQALGKNSTIQP